VSFAEAEPNANADIAIQGSLPYDGAEGLFIEGLAGPETMLDNVILTSTVEPPKAISLCYNWNYGDCQDFWVK